MAPFGKYHFTAWQRYHLESEESFGRCTGDRLCDEFMNG